MYNVLEFSGELRTRATFDETPSGLRIEIIRKILGSFYPGRKH
jgi:hypothetical protein